MIPSCIADLSHWDRDAGPYDLAKAKAAGIQAVVLKASQGSAYHDSAYSEWAIAAFRQKMAVGAYHFGDSSPVATQLKCFLDCVPGQVPLLALDWEENTMNVGGSMTFSKACEFIALLRLARPAASIWLYCGAWAREFLAGILKSTAIAASPLATCRIWYADYRAEPPAQIPGLRPIELWQYAGDGQGSGRTTLPGISGNPDLNHWLGTQEELNAAFGIGPPECVA